MTATARAQRRIIQLRESIGRDTAELVELIEGLGKPAEWPTVASPVIGYLTLAQVAEAFGVSRDTICRWIRSRGMPHYAIPDGRGARLLFRKSELERWMARKFRNGAAR